MARKPTLMCSKCKVTVIPRKASFSYLGRAFQHEVLRCPECGQIYLPEGFAKGKMSEVETKIEDDFRSLNG